MDHRTSSYLNHMKQKIIGWFGGFILIALAVHFMVARAAKSLQPVDSPADSMVKTIRLLPLGPGAQTLAHQTQKQLSAFISKIERLPPSALPASAFYRPRGRYRADSLIHWMSRQAHSNEVLLGITTADISTTKNGKPDWGVMGLGFCPGNAAVASSHRLGNKSQFWKVAIHELGHTSGLPHCPVKTCFMRDAGGGNPTEDEKEFCSKCKAVLINVGWKMGG